MGVNWETYVSDADRKEQKRQELADAGAVSAVKPLRGLDCKDLTLLASAKVSGLTPVAGYIAWPEREQFTEHWWCMAGNRVVDATGMALLPGVALRPLDDQADDKRGVCLAYEGQCDHVYVDENDEPIDPDDSACSWCSARGVLESIGFQRAPLDLIWRPMIGMVLGELRVLRSEVMSLRKQIAKTPKKGSIR